MAVRPANRRDSPTSSRAKPRRGDGGRPASARGPRTRKRPATPIIGVALAGGGPVGAMYEIGALCALSEALEGIDLNEVDIYVGVSAGSFIAAGLANGITPFQMARIFVESEAADEPFDPAMLLQSAIGEYLMRFAELPPLLLGSIWSYVTKPGRAGAIEGFKRLSQALPTGLFNNAHIDEFLGRVFSGDHRTNDFRHLPSRLFLVATELETGAVVEFGAPGLAHVPISRAVQASSALPGLYPPVEIEGRYYVDGALKKTLHASCAYKAGARLVIGINPLVPFDAELARKSGAQHHRSLAKGGLPMVLSQTFRALIHSRMEASLAKYAVEYPDLDMVLFQPDPHDEDLFFTNLFSYASRRKMCEHAYQRTREDLWRRRKTLAPVLARHGITLNTGVLRDRSLHLIRKAPRLHLGQPTTPRNAADRLAESLDDLDRWVRYMRSRSAPA